MNKTGKKGASKTSIIIIVVAIIVLCMIGIAIYLSYDTEDLYWSLCVS